MSSRLTKHEKAVKAALEQARSMTADAAKRLAPSYREQCRQTIRALGDFLEHVLAPPPEEDPNARPRKAPDPYATRSTERMVSAAISMIRPDPVDFFDAYESYPAEVEAECARVPKRYKNRVMRVIDDSALPPASFATAIRALNSFCAAVKREHPLPKSLDEVKDLRTFRSQERMIQGAILALKPGFEDFASAADEIIFNDVCADRHPLTDATPPAPPAVEPVVYPPPEPSLTAALIDCDWEHVGDETHMFLYSRELTGRACLVTVPFLDYFYVKITLKFPEKLLRDMVVAAASKITQERFRSGPKVINSLESTEYICKMERVEGYKTVYGYMPFDQIFLKVYVRSPVVCAKLLKLLPKEVPDNVNQELQMFEIHTDPVTKFLVGSKVTGTGFFTADNVEERENTLSTCDRHVHVDRVKGVPDGVHVYEPITMYYDIETLSYDLDIFPRPEHCPCFQISYAICKGSALLRKGVLCMRETPEHEWYHHEAQVLIRFAQLVHEFNPDAFVGYYSNNFDMPYILTRMKVLGIERFAACFSRRKDRPVTYRVVTVVSKQKGAQDKYKYNAPGRCFVDMALQIRNDGAMRLTSYKLKDVCAKYLPKGVNKLELHYDKFPELFKTREGRLKLADYCLQDSMILPDLDVATMVTTRVWALARVIGTTPSTIVERGNTMLLMIKMKEYTEREKFLIPTMKRVELDENDESNKLKGGYVFEPEPKMYHDPVVVLDFASLYPSIMMGWNLCFTTILLPGELQSWKQENPDKFEVFEDVPFVKSSTYRGIVPKIEEDTGRERKKYKALMKKEKEANGKSSVLYGIYDAMQQAYKVIMNSLYGMLAASIAQIPCLSIAQVITGLGRRSLHRSEVYVNENYEKITGDKDGRVIYGDTDSIFIVMPGVSLEKAIAHGKLLDKCIQRDLFASRPPMEMEYEKTFWPFVIIKAKAYAGAMYEFDVNKVERKETGLASVRFDKAKLCHKMLDSYLDTVLLDRDPEGALRHITHYIKGVMEDTLPPEDYAVIAKINKRPGMYKKGQPPPATRAWMRMVERVGPQVAPAVGDNFTFFVEEGHKEKGDAMKDELLMRQIIRKEGVFRFDKKSYIDTYIINPVSDLLTAISGSETRDRVLNYANYDRVDRIPCRKGTIAGAFGARGLKHVRKADQTSKDTYSFNTSKVKRAKKCKGEGAVRPINSFFKLKK